jgi:hypothetical protein
VFPTDLPGVDYLLRNWGGAYEGPWGKYEVVPRGPKAEVSAAKLDTTQLDVPVLHLDTTENGLAEDLRSAGFTCSAAAETCTGKPGLAAKFSGPDSGITYLVATARAGAAFDELTTEIFGHLSGDAVGPVRAWVTQHLDGRSHGAYVAGWRVDLEAVPGKQLRLTLFNEEIWMAMSG